MAVNGIMAEIRRQLVQGKTAQELIAEGYKQGSVFKARWQLRRRGELESPTPLAHRPSIAALEQPHTPQMVTQGVSLQSENEKNEQLREEIARLRQEVEEAASLQMELDQAHARMELLESEANQAQALRERIEVLKPEAETTPRLRQRVRELENQLQHAAHTEAALRQEVVQSQRKYEGIQSGFQEAKRQAEARRKIEQGVWQQNQEQGQRIATMQQAIEALNYQLQRLAPLEVWSGHPCSVCNRPMSGVVARETAARVMKEFGHKDCLEQSNSRVGKLALAGAAIGAGLLGLSRANHQR